MENGFPSYTKAQKIVKREGISCNDEYKKRYKELGLPSSPSVHYKDKGWISSFDFFGKEKKEYPSYEKAIIIVQNEGVKSSHDYKTSFNKLGLPAHPYTYYKDKGWTDWYDFLGMTKASYPSYEKAKEIVQKEGIKNAGDYLKSCKKLGLPSNPLNAYKDKGWTDWYDFLGMTKASYPSYEKAKEIVQKEGIKSVGDYLMSCKKLGLPSSPLNAYKDKGWVDWYDFLGKSRRDSLNERKYKILTKLSISPFLLQDDAPLQVIYILASELDKKLAKEMEELLTKTSFEERLNWVKEQLNKLKEGGYSIHKTTFVTPSDELSAMESILEEFHVTDKVSFTLENYLHSAVNRELISEYDG